MPRKKDWAEKQTDQMLSELEGRINDEYSTAYKELSEKCDKYFAGFEKRDIAKLSQVSAGQISQEEYKEWRKNQMLIGQRWSDMVDTMAKDLTKVDQKVISMTRGFLPEAYALNHNYGTYEGEKSTHVDTAYTLYDRHTVERLLRDQPNMLPALKPNSPTARKLAERKDLIWNKQHLNSAITQGVLQGDDLRSVSKRLQSVTDMDNKAAKRNARTMMTGAQNSGRLDSYKRMQEMGIEVQKQWMATLDHYTRSSHAHLDGEKVDIDEKFANGLQYPGDKDGRPEEVYNCRCTMIAYFPEYPYENMQRYDNIEGKPIDEVTYTEWAKAHGLKNADIMPKKDYDFEGKLALYTASKENVNQARQKFAQAQTDYKYSQSREDQIQRAKERYDDVADLTEDDISKMKKRIKEIEEQAKETEDANDRWYERPSRDKPEELEAWREWKREWMGKYGDTAPEILSRLQVEQYNYMEKIRRYERLQEEIEFAQRFKPKAELLEIFEKAQDELKKAEEAFNKNFTRMDELLLDAYKKIPYKKTGILDKSLSGNDIILKLAGGDMTEGSCQSLALCYAANKAGIDVIDFRGGLSQDFFADYRIPDVLLNVGMKGRKETGYNEQKLALKLLKGMEDDKEYILSGGEHAAVVKRIVNTSGDIEYQYLELQSQHSVFNGWRTLGFSDNDKGIAGELKWRFGMQQSRSWRGQKYERTVYLLDVDSAKDVDNFDTLLGFMNTDPDKQKKGSRGNIK